MANGHGGARAGAGRPKGSKNGRSRFQEARTRKEEALAQLRELQLSRERGELVPRSAVCTEWQRLCSIVRQQLLGIPTRVGAVHGPEAAATVKRLIWQALRELASSDGLPQERADA